MILGVRGRGRQRNGPFDHKTGRGWVAQTKGSYYDALAVKKFRVVPLIVETFGGIAPSARAHIGWLARRTKGRHGRDSTKYGSSRCSPRGFYVHHTQRISLAAILGDAKGIRRKINGIRAQRLGRACAVP